MWQKVDPLRRPFSGVSITPQNVNGKLRSVSLLMLPEVWQGELPRGFDLFVDTTILSLRIQAGDSYAGKAAQGTRRLRFSCMQALNVLGIPTPSTTIKPPFKWHDGGLEIDLSQWGKE